MSHQTNSPASWKVIVAFATLYIVWGSTYYFIKEALGGFPTLLLGAFRFTIAGLLMLVYCIVSKEDVWNIRVIKKASFIGFLLLFIGNGAVVFAENNISSSLAAILISAGPIWFLIIDKPMWKHNLSSWGTMLGILIGFIGVILLFYDNLKDININADISVIIAMTVLILGSISWASGSIYSKYKGEGSAVVNTTWQMLAAAVLFYIAAICSGEWETFQSLETTSYHWFSLIYLAIMGSIAGYGAYVWLLSVRPVTQVSTYAYVNPVIAIIIGALFANEVISTYQLIGLSIILISILLINLNKYIQKQKQS